MSDNGSPPAPFLMAMVEDTPDARLFIELSSYGADLAEAVRALDLAIQGDDQDSPFADAQQFLIEFAVVAYCRCFMPSTVREKLTHHVGVPLEFAKTHDLVVTFRNRTIAHSQSDLAVTYPVGVLESATLVVRDVMAVTVVSPLPPLVVRQFRTLATTMEALLDVVLFPIRERLKDNLRATDRTDLVDLPRPIEKLAEEFNPKSTRHSYPTSHTLYWDVSDDLDPPT